MPDPVKLIATLRMAAEAFRRMPGRRGHVVYLEEGDEVMAVGDLHGHLARFAQVLKKADLANHPGRHLVLQELIHGPHRYPDGSDRSHQMLDLLAALKCQFPRRVHLLMGNHELAQWADRQVGKGDEMTLNDLFRAGVRSAYGEQADVVYRGYTSLFEVMPLAIRTPNRVFLSHSLPKATRLTGFDLEALEHDGLPPSELASGGSAHSLVWGRDTSEANAAAFLGNVDADLLITGHMPCDGGFDTPNSRQLVLDSSEAQACYCLFPIREPVTLRDLVDGVRVL